MSQAHDIKISCECGAQLIYSERVTSDYSDGTPYRAAEFYKAHEVCRTKANTSQVVTRLLEQSND